MDFLHSVVMLSYFCIITIFYIAFVLYLYHTLLLYCNFSFYYITFCNIIFLLLNIWIFILYFLTLLILISKRQKLRAQCYKTYYPAVIYECS
jgi:hypothetical protein